MAPIKLGIVDFDTSHAVEFTRRLNQRGIAEDQWVSGAQVVLGWPGTSKIAPEIIAGNAKELEKLGVTLVDKPEQMIGKVDGMLIESQQGSVHLERAAPFLEAGIPCFIDKPLTCGVADARMLVELAERKKAPIFSASSLRYAPEVVSFLAEPKHGKLQGAMTYGPATLHEGNPALYHYGIHPVELLYTLMGPGCERVACTHEADVDVVTGQWKGGRVGTVHGLRAGKRAYGFVAFTDKDVQTVSVGTTFIYRELLKQVVALFKTGKPPLDVAETVEIMAFIEAAWKSGLNHGAGEKVAT